MSKPFFYRIDAASFLMEVVTTPENERAQKFYQLAIDMVSGKGTFPYSKQIISEVKQFKAKKSEAGRKGMENRWLRDNSVITKDNTVITKTDSVITRSSTETETNKPKELHPLAVMWNDVVKSGSKVISCNDGRLRKITKRLKERSIEEWPAIFNRIESTPFLRGENNQKWKADFDWIIENDTNYIKVLEGKYGSSEEVKTDRQIMVALIPAMAGCR